MKHLVKKRYTVTRPRLLNTNLTQSDVANRSSCETSSARSTEKRLDFGSITASSQSNPIGYSTQITPENHRNHGLGSVAISSGTAVAGKQIGSTTNTYLNSSYLISNYFAKNNDTNLFIGDGVLLGNRTSPFSDPAKSDLLGHNRKLLAALQRMERIEGRINSLESKFKSMNECIRTRTSTSKKVIQPAEPKPVVKEWHSEINLSLREHLITKLTNAVFPIMPNTDDRIRIAIVSYTRKIENDIFEAANSKAEYYQLLSERHYTLSKQIDERKRKKALQLKQN